MAAVADPLGGSYYVEALTDRIEAEANAIIQTIDDMGGIVRAVEAGWPQREIAASAYRTQRQIDSGRAGGGRRQPAHAGGAQRHTIPTLKIDERPERAAARGRGRAARRGATAELRERRSSACARRLRGDDAAATSWRRVLEAARRDATLGEICRVFREVFGEYRDPAEV